MSAPLVLTGFYAPPPRPNLHVKTSEAITLLNQVIDLDLSLGGVTALEARTEGRSAGLQLAALSRHTRDDAGTGPARLAGDSE